MDSSGTFFSRHVRDSMCNGKFRAAANDKFAAVHSNIFRVLGAQGSRDYLDRRAPEGDVPLPLHIHKSFVDRATNPYPTGHCLLRIFFLFSFVFIQIVLTNNDSSIHMTFSIFLFRRNNLSLLIICSTLKYCIGLNL